MLRHFADHGLVIYFSLNLELTRELTSICRHSGRIRVERTEHQLGYSKEFDYISGLLSKQSSMIESGSTVCLEADIPS